MSTNSFDKNFVINDVEMAKKLTDMVSEEKKRNKNRNNIVEELEKSKRLVEECLKRSKMAH